MNSNLAHANRNEDLEHRARRPTLRAVTPLRRTDRPTLRALPSVHLRIREDEAPDAPAPEASVGVTALLSAGLSLSMIAGSFFGYYVLGPAAATALGLA